MSDDFQLDPNAEEFNLDIYGKVEDVNSSFKDKRNIQHEFHFEITEYRKISGSMSMSKKVFSKIMNIDPSYFSNLNICCDDDYILNSIRILINWSISITYIPKIQDFIDFMSIYRAERKLINLLRNNPMLMYYGHINSSIENKLILDEAERTVDTLIIHATGKKMIFDNVSLKFNYFLTSNLMLDYSFPIIRDLRFRNYVEYGARKIINMVEDSIILINIEYSSYVKIQSIISKNTPNPILLFGSRFKISRVKRKISNNNVFFHHVFCDNINITVYEEAIKFDLIFRTLEKDFKIIIASKENFDLEIFNIENFQNCEFINID